MAKRDAVAAVLGTRGIKGYVDAMLDAVLRQHAARAGPPGSGEWGGADERGSREPGVAQLTHLLDSSAQACLGHPTVAFEHSAVVTGQPVEAVVPLGSL